MLKDFQTIKELCHTLIAVLTIWHKSENQHAQDATNRYWTELRPLLMKYRESLKISGPDSTTIQLEDCGCGTFPHIYELVNSLYTRL